jgi:hypothetical protein
MNKTTFLGILGLVVAVAGWIINDFSVEAKELRQDTRTLKQQTLIEFGKIGGKEADILLGLAKNDVAHESFHRRFDRLEEKVDKIYDILLKEKRR